MSTPHDYLPPPPRLALVGDRSNEVQAHSRIPAILQALNSGPEDPLEVYWFGTAGIAGPSDVAGFDGVWVLPGSPGHAAGVRAAIESARTTATPLLGTCGGFQHLLLEFARNVCGLDKVAHAEEEPDAPERLIVPLACSLLGEEDAIVELPGHPFFVASLFQPELSSSSIWVHPLIAAFARAARAHAAAAAVAADRARAAR